MTSALKINESITDMNAISGSKNLSELAQQVAHDIRSPLSALNILTRACNTQMSEEAKSLMLAAIQRINDIADDLLKVNSVSKKCNAPEKTVQPEDIVPIVNEIIQEKKINLQSSTKKNVNIQLSLKETLNAICEVNKCELQRVISNLLENAVEAIEFTPGTVTVSVDTNGDAVNVQISDNGKGIPSHILTKVGSRGFSYGKSSRNSGSGLGLYHAKSVIDSYGGELKIASITLVGTVILIKLPKYKC